MPYDSAYPLRIEHVAYEGIGKLVEEGKYDTTGMLINLKNSYAMIQSPEKSARKVADDSNILLSREFDKKPFLGVKNLHSGESLPFIDETFSVITENGEELEKNYFGGIERLYEYKGNKFLTVEEPCHRGIRDWKNVFIKVSDNQAQPSMAQESLNPDVFAYEAIGKYELSKGKTWLLFGLKELKENALKNRIDFKAPSGLVVQKNIDGRQYVGFSNLSLKSRCELIRNGIKNLEENDKGYADKSGIKYVAKADAFLLIRNSLTKEREVFIEIPKGKPKQENL
jgi:hypothetical protein